MKRKASTRNMVEMGKIPPAPKHQGKIVIDSRTEIEIPLWVTDIPAYTRKVIEKYTNYDKKNETARLTGAAKTNLLKP